MDWQMTGICPECGGQVKCVIAHPRQELASDPNVPDQFIIVRQWEEVEYACGSCSWLATVDHEHPVVKEAINA